MVAETKETNTTDMLEMMTKNARATMDAGRRMQDGWFDSFANFGSHADAQKNVAGESARMAKNWFTLVCDNWQSLGDATQKCFQTSLDVFRVACDTPPTMGEGDVYDSQRKVMDSAFQALQKNVDTMNQAGKSTADRWTTFTKANSCCGTGTPKASTKNGK